MWTRTTAPTTTSTTTPKIAKETTHQALFLRCAPDAAMPGPAAGNSSLGDEKAGGPAAGNPTIGGGKAGGPAAGNPPIGGGKAGGCAAGNPTLGGGRPGCSAAGNSIMGEGILGKGIVGGSASPAPWGPPPCGPSKVIGSSTTLPILRPDAAPPARATLWAHQTEPHGRLAPHRGKNPNSLGPRRPHRGTGAVLPCRGSGQRCRSDQLPCGSFTTRSLPRSATYTFQEESTATPNGV